MNTKLMTFAMATLFSTNLLANNYWVALKAENKEKRTELANFMHLDAIVDDTVYSTVNQWTYDKILNEHKSKLVDSHIIPESFNKSDEERFPRGDEKFHTYVQMEQLLKELHQKYPDYTTLTSLGKSSEGREIYALTITEKSNNKKGNFIPTIAFLGSHHAREHLSTEVPLLSAKNILENLEANPSLQDLVSTKKLVFIPMVNPDGAMYDIRGGSYRYWRKNRTVQNNAVGVDLNRNYDHDWGRAGSSTSPRSDTYQGVSPFSEPETQAIKHYVEETPELVGMISYHSFGELVLHPWGGRYDPVGGEDQKIFEKHGKEMARITKYKSQQSSDLYAASGDTCDWAYAQSGVYCYTIELSPGKSGRGGFYPGASVIPEVVQSNLSAMLYFAKNIK